ncbi:MAG: DUF5686 family protein [Prevotella pectinovora]|uniref:DUF5686 family protein n=1 Tax=Prevotella pectinovora TaxID=1602169 RepID=UPI002A8173D9|nr:DUF5686 family protein [Prevotella pectinovora]MDY4779115.1 DUF5686 family protein [Prevotella pectinovora]
MKRLKSLFILLLLSTLMASAQQITGVIVDEATGDSIPLASIRYKGHGKSYVSDNGGRFTIEKHDGWYATFSAVGYQDLKLLIGTNSPNHMRITLKPDTKSLSGVTVKSKRRRYKRKENPAVALMRRVIAAKKRTDIENHDFFQYAKYQKLTLAVNDISPKELERKGTKKTNWMVNQVEACPYNNKLIMPVMVDETISRQIYRKDPHSEKTIIVGQHMDGVNKFIQTGEVMGTVMKDVFSNVNIYDDQIRLLQARFTSPIGKDAIQFYRYYIVDTVKVERDSCFHLQFLPNNQQDFGFSGELWIVKDSTLHVKRCHLTLPSKSGVNFVEGMQIQQAYTKLDNGEWVLTQDDMVAELSLLSVLTKAIVIRNTRMTDYGFDSIPAKHFKGKQKEIYQPDAKIRDRMFWQQVRMVPLTRSEARMPQFLRDIENSRNFKYALFALKVAIENFVETGSQQTPSKFDIGPINTMITSNFVDGTRTRLSGQTTANLNRHWFLKGYYAHGWGSRKNYYNADLTYSFNAKQYLPHEYPKRTLTLSSSHDVCSPSDKFLITDKDNVFTSLKWTKVKEMMFYNRQQLAFEYEWYGGLKAMAKLKTEENEACGDLKFIPLSANGVAPAEPWKIRTTEASVMLRYAPGETVVNTKQNRVSVNREAPVFTISHTMGVKGVLGGDYNYNFTEATIYKRFWMNSWGDLNVDLRGGIQWNKVPFPLLIMPAANLSYLAQYGTFNLINNMEFLNDRYASIDVWWNMNGKILNRIPFIKKLKWREYIGVKCLWGNLTEKNNPYSACNIGNTQLMQFPDGAHLMDKNKPYVEIVAGVSNIFKVLSVQYVRRLNYLDLPTAHKQGVRFKLMFKF